MKKRFGSPLIPIGMFGLACAQLLQRIIGPGAPFAFLSGAGGGCLLLGFLLSRPSLSKFKATKKRLIYGGLSERKRRTSN